MVELTAHARELIRRSEEEYRSPKTGEAAPLEHLFLLEVIHLFSPIFLLPLPGFISGKLWGAYLTPVGGLNRLLGYGINKRGPKWSIVDALGNAQHFLSGPGASRVKSKRNLARDDAYETFAPPTREFHESSLPAVASLQGDIVSVLLRKRGRLTRQTESRLVGLLCWLGEWREGVFDFDAFAFWTSAGSLPWKEVLPALDGYAPDLKALRRRLQRGVFVRAKKGRSGWNRGVTPRIRGMRGAADHLGGFFVQKRPTTEPEEDEEAGYGSWERPCPSAIIRELANGLLDAAAPAPPPEPDAYYEAKKRATLTVGGGCDCRLRGRPCLMEPRSGRLFQPPDVVSGGFPDAESLQPRLDPWHPRKIAREIVDRVRTWTEAALLDRAGHELPFSDLEAEDEEGWSEALPFERFLAATPGVASPLTPTNCILNRGNVLKAPNLELQVWLRECEIALSRVWPTLTQMQRELLMWVGRHRDLPMSQNERKRKGRALVNVRKPYFQELERVQRHYRLAHPRFFPDEIDLEVKQLLVAEETRGRKPDTCSGEKSAVAVIHEKTFLAPPAACWVWEAGKPKHNEIRWAWRLVYGEISQKTEVVQACRNPRCVNPGHLALDPTPERKKQRNPPELVLGNGLVKVEARRGLLYNGHRYERGAAFYTYQTVAEAAVRVGAVALLS